MKGDQWVHSRSLDTTYLTCQHFCMELTGAVGRSCCQGLFGVLHQVPCHTGKHYKHQISHLRQPQMGLDFGKLVSGQRPSLYCSETLLGP